MVARHRVNEGSTRSAACLRRLLRERVLRGPDGRKISVLRTPLQLVEGNALIKDRPDPAVEEIKCRLFVAKEAH
jgi:hypothetical protein